MRDSISGLLKLFVERRAFYTLAEARRLTQVSAARLEQAIGEGAVELVPDGASLVLAWEDVVALALTRWTPRQIAHITRGAGHPHLLPALNRFRRITVELPVYQIRLLHYLAQRRSPRGAPPLAVSDVLEYELSALAFEEDLVAIERAIPGVAAAAHYPSPVAPFDDGPQPAGERCMFCGGGVAPGEDACAVCRPRHVPA